MWFNFVSRQRLFWKKSSDLIKDFWKGFVFLMPNKFQLDFSILIWISCAKPNAAQAPNMWGGLAPHGQVPVLPLLIIAKERKMRWCYFWFPISNLTKQRCPRPRVATRREVSPERAPPQGRKLCTFLFEKDESENLIVNDKEINQERISIIRQISRHDWWMEKLRSNCKNKLNSNQNSKNKLKVQE